MGAPARWRLAVAGHTPASPQAACKQETPPVAPNNHPHMPPGPQPQRAPVTKHSFSRWSLREVGRCSRRRSRAPASCRRLLLGKADSRHSRSTSACSRSAAGARRSFSTSASCAMALLVTTARIAHCQRRTARARCVASPSPARWWGEEGEGASSCEGDTGRRGLFSQAHALLQVAVPPLLPQGSPHLLAAVGGAVPQQRCASPQPRPPAVSGSSGVSARVARVRPFGRTYYTLQRQPLPCAGSPAAHSLPQALWRRRRGQGAPFAACPGRQVQRGACGCQASAVLMRVGLEGAVVSAAGQDQLVRSPALHVEALPGRGRLAPLPLHRGTCKGVQGGSSAWVL